MNKAILGLHHVTAIASDPQTNLDFYTTVLGLRLVKLTVNFDDPGTYHFYFGDYAGNPGTIMTFFPWPNSYPGRVGTGQTSATAFAIPSGSADYWLQRITEFGISIEESKPRFGDRVLTFPDPDNMPLELIETQVSGTVPKGNQAIIGFHSVTLSERKKQATQHILTDVMGYELIAQEGNRYRYAVGNSKPGQLIDIVESPTTPLGVSGAGTVHHIAFRTPDDDQQIAWMETIRDEGMNVSPVMDRNYFHSIYYREPGGVLFEIATDPPGFAIDEPLESLGEELKLPEQYEKHRAEIVQALPKLQRSNGS